MRLPQNDSATGRAIKTAVQAIIGFMVGLFIAVWAVPGVPDAVWSYIQSNLLQVLLAVGLPAGVTSLVWNVIFRPDVRNY